MPTKYFEVLDQYDAKKHGEIKAPPSVLKCIELLKKGDIFSPKKFAEENMKFLNTNSSKLNATLFTVSKTVRIAKDIGIIRTVDERPISYADFCNLDSVQYFLNQLRGSKMKNLESNAIKENSTKRHYLQQIYHFNNWLHGKTFEFSITKQIDVDVFKKTKERMTLDGIEQFLSLYQSSHNTESEFIKVVKLYLMDQIHVGCSAKYMSVKHSAITSYFDKNDSPMKFKYSAHNNHADYKEENENATITLDEVYKLITHGKASPLEKAVVICRFHRGLDSSTLADRFNFQVWEQLVKWFGHNDFENWDLKKCPVPIRVTRVKTNYLHTGYLDHDAIVAIQEYLNYRYQSYLRVCRYKKMDDGYILKKNQIMQNDNPLFVDKNNKPISINWCSRLVPRLALKAGIQNNMKGNRLQNKSEKIGHELRDLLKSTLIVSGTVDYVCQLAIGHTIGDSYEKQDKLYPEKSRSEFAKASSKLNIFSKVSNYLENGDDIEQYKIQYKDLVNNMESRVTDRLIQFRDELLEKVEKEKKRTEEIREQARKESLEYMEESRKEVHAKWEKLRQDPEKIKRLKELFEMLEN